MANQMRYPRDFTQDNKIDSVKWQDLENLFIDDWQYLASCEIEGKVAPQVFCVKDFNFNIPDGALIHSLDIRFDFHRDSSPESIKIAPPIVELIGVEEDEFKQRATFEANTTSIERSVLFEGEEITSDEINSKEFGVKFTFPKNINENSGTLFFDFVRIAINYEEQKFVLSSGELNPYFPDKDNPLEKAVGEEIAYTSLFRNANGINTDQQEVQIVVPEGFELVKYYFGSDKPSKIDEDEEDFGEDVFDPETFIWYPGVRLEGVSRLRLILKCVEEGEKYIYAYSKNADTTPKFYVNIHPEGYECEPSMFEETLLKWDSELSDDEEYQLLNQEVAIEVKKVDMEFEKAQEKVDNLKEYVIKWLKRELKPKTHFQALNNVSFTINKGERVGLIGFNGAGKSTLLKILAGVLKPTKGSTYVNGKVAPLLELGAGFDHNYNGRENIFLNGAILGYSREFLEGKYDEIVEFSELEDFIELPIKNYSSGMIAKLGFSVATVVEPEILILDEILSVGDVRFQQKSSDKLKSMMKSGTTVLLVSHSINTIRSMCNRVIWLDKGKVVMDGYTSDVCDAYIEAAKSASEEELKDLEL